MRRRPTVQAADLRKWWSRLSESNRRPIQYEPPDPTSTDARPRTKTRVSAPVRTSAYVGGQPTTETRTETNLRSRACPAGVAHRAHGRTRRSASPCSAAGVARVWPWWDGEVKDGGSDHGASPACRAGPEDCHRAAAHSADGREDPWPGLSFLPRHRESVRSSRS